MSSSKQPPVIHPLLFAFFPVLFLYARNSQIIALAEIVVPLSVIGGMAVGFTAICSLAARSIQKGGIIATSTAFLFLSYGHFKQALPEFEYTIAESVIGPSFVIVLASLLILIIIAVTTVKTRRNLDSVTKSLNFIGSVLVAMELLHGGYALATREDYANVNQGPVTEVKKAENRPDIYYIILDGYARSDILREIYGYDNSPFVATLRNLGFYVADSSFANYPQTILSLASSLNMDYAGNLGHPERSSGDLVPMRRKIRESAVVRFLEDLGYTSVVFASGFGPTEIKADRKISPGWYVGEFPSLIIAMTPLPTVLGGSLTPLARHRRRILFALDELPNLSGIRSPKFVFAHILCPHAPFVFDAAGNEVQYSNFLSLADGVTMIKDSSDAEDYRQRYREQIAFITERLTETITQLVKSSPEEPPVIILQADHGPASGLKWEDWTVSNLRERFGILNAYYLPGVDDSVLYDEISPVNSFRAVLNHYFGTEFELLPDRHEFASMRLPYALQFISRHLGRSTYDHLMKQYDGQPPDSVSLDKVSEVLREGTEFTSDSYLPITERGLLVRLDFITHSGRCEISTDWNDSYEVQYRQDTTIIATDRIPPRDGRGGRLRVEELTVPAMAQQRGFDNLLIFPSNGDYVYGIGHILFF